MLLTVENVSKGYPGLPVLHDVSLNVDSGEIVCLLGPSGCGKTTLLRLIAGLEAPDRGRILLEGRDLAPVPVHHRNFGLMFQDFALFPHRNVAENVAFGLRMQGHPTREVEERVDTALELVSLAGYQRRRVLDLSGGEQQRVALARSLAPRPLLLMLDEPLGALDRALREQLMAELRTIIKRVGVTAIYVTHDQEEAFAVADRVVIMRARLEAGEGGRVEQIGTPAHVYRYPATAAVAGFLGFRNLIRGVVLPDLAVRAKTDVPAQAVLAQTGLGPLLVGDAPTRPPAGSEVMVLIRPEAAILLPAAARAPNMVTGQLVERSFRGSYFVIRTAHPGGTELISEVSLDNADLPAVGEPVTLRLRPQAITLLAEGERMFGPP